MIYFILGISFMFNIISIIIFFYQYKYSLKGIKHKLENYVLENLMDQDTIYSNNDLNSIKGLKNEFNNILDSMEELYDNK